MAGAASSSRLRWGRTETATRTGAVTGPPSPNGRAVVVGTVDLLGAESPSGATAPCLAFPDGNGVLDGVDAELRGCEGLGAMGCRRPHHDRHFSHLELADPVEKGEAADLIPSLAGLIGHPAEP